MAENNDFTKSEQNSLSIRLGTDGFSFSILNPLREGEPVIYEQAIAETLSLTANLKELLKKREELNHPFRQVKVITANKRYTFVPLALFDDEQAESIFYYNHPRQENETVQYNILPKSDIVVIFAMDKSVCQCLQEQYADVQFFSHITPLVEYFSGRSRLGNSRKVYANIRQKALDVLVCERGRLLLANTFAATSTADRIYYLLYVWQQLNFDQERDELHLCGELPDKADLLNRLRQFVRQVFIMNPTRHIELHALNEYW